MKYSSSYRQKEYYDTLDEIHFGLISEALDYYEDQLGTKNGCLEILNMNEQKFNKAPITNELLHKIIEKYPQLRLEFYELNDLIQYYTSGYQTDKIAFHFPADSYNLMFTLLKLNVSDIVLDEPFVFDIKRISEYIRYYKEDCKIHIRPYLGKPSYMSATESIMHHFWVLPQHIYLYEEYVDYIDLFATGEAREKRLVELYCIKKEYTNLLGPLVNNSADKDKQMSSAFVTDELAQVRLGCKQICLTRTPSLCHQCDHCFRFMRAIAKDFKAVKNGESSKLLEN